VTDLCDEGGTRLEPRKESRREARCSAILDAAESLFLEKGFERTPLSAIVARSGGSLATLYDVFGSKENLLRAVAARLREDGLQNLRSIAAATASPREILFQLAIDFHAFVMSHKTLKFTRMVIAHSLENPEFGRAFHRDLRLNIAEQLAETLERWNFEGKARIHHPAEAADLYFATILCDAPMKALLGLPPEPTDPDLIARRLASLFLQWEIVA
jgi:TetR/AcrR family transcriptional regulator, mexJK operon transcriptional repressor